MSWVYLLLAGCMEIVGVIALKKYSLSGRNIFLLGILVQFMLSFSLLSLAMQEITMATAYAIWTGIGAGGGVLIGILFFKESKNLKKLLFITLIIASVIGLKAIG
ncbi:multidrug efflux SMR transporter [Helicobacter apodemus]|uniref:Guanidinium exporter n=1 Tax=Helicobacter apodemus TaxID=135569 RepID=A0A4U8UFW1_9HELI|nr:multidrug efflux SMR transporter [Helicobacter apodemus]MDE6958943.1 multidrug efflux SMR transporter [Helicobacter apodemus]TLE16166.1 multidrug efflux SMR transporter [Helicobacter apodemus]